MVLDIGSIGVSVVVNVIIVIVVLFVALKKAIIPILTAVIEEKIQETDNMMKAAASALGTKSGEARQYAKLEKMVITDLFDEYPEIEIAMDRFSPETADYMRENPRAALSLYRRWKPVIDQFLGEQAQGRGQYDIS